LQDNRSTIMKRLTKPGFYIIAFCLATFIFVACSTNGIQRSGNAQASLEAVDNDIQKIVIQIDKIGAALDKLTSPGETDARQAYDQYSASLSTIEKLEIDFQKHVKEMETNNKAYLREWKKNSNE
jgi:conjugal transfer/entry exclusion protein